MMGLLLVYTLISNFLLTKIADLCILLYIHTVQAIIRRQHNYEIIIWNKDLHTSWNHGYAATPRPVFKTILVVQTVLSAK